MSEPIDLRKINLRQMLCFAILMENQDGILDKSPDYIQEKFAACMMEPKWCEELLDPSNQVLLAGYYMKWRVRADTLVVDTGGGRWQSALR